MVTLTDHQGEEDGLAEPDGRRHFALVFFHLHLFTKYKKTGCVTIATKTQTGCDVSRVNYAYPALLLVLHAEIKCITGTNDKRLGGTDGLRRAADGSNIKLDPYSGVCSTRSFLPSNRSASATALFREAREEKNKSRLPCSCKVGFKRIILSLWLRVWFEISSLARWCCL